MDPEIAVAVAIFEVESPEALTATIRYRYVVPALAVVSLQTSSVPLTVVRTVQIDTVCGVIATPVMPYAPGRAVSRYGVVGSMASWPVTVSAPGLAVRLSESSAPTPHAICAATLTAESDPAATVVLGGFVRSPARVCTERRFAEV